MMQRRDHPLVFVADLASTQLDEANDRHLTRSLRLKPGDSFFVSDGAGSWREAALAANGLSHRSEISYEEPPVINKGVAFTPVKGDKSAWVVQKLTELNMDKIVLIEAERSVVRWDSQRRSKQLEKLRRVAVEACGQCRRVWFPEITFSDLAIVASNPGAVLAEPGGRPITNRDHLVVVGPEGGWSKAELGLADHVKLPGGILRAETAALAAAVQISAYS